MRERLSMPIGNIEVTKKELLRWAAEHEYACYLDSNNYPQTYTSYQCLVAAGAIEVLTANAGAAFTQLQAKLNEQPDWWFGYLGYDLKNEVEKLSSNNADWLDFADLCFFRPEHVLYIKDKELIVESTSPKTIFDSFFDHQPAPKPTATGIGMQPRMSKQAYLDTIAQLKQHIKDGDVYEINFCQEFYAEGITIDTAAVFEKLNALSQAPFAAYLKLADKQAMCSSPERFLKKEGSKLISQPIKGTRKRGATPEEDEQLRTELKASEKERAENVMIVDLVRNDLSRSCKPGTVEVEELFGIHSFKQVHQMISTVVGELKPEIDKVDAIKQAFPMGSMTGAPKVRMMQLAEQYEQSKRGLYSGAIGYFDPAGDFDLNVVIRSLLYNTTNQYLSYHVGGAIVWDSVPEEEYEECLVKAAAMQQAMLH